MTATEDLEPRPRPVRRRPPPWVDELVARRRYQSQRETAHRAAAERAARLERHRTGGPIAVTFGGMGGPGAGNLGGFGGGPGFGGAAAGMAAQSGALRTARLEAEAAAAITAQRKAQRR